MTVENRVVNPTPGQVAKYWDYKKERPNEQVELGIKDASGKWTLRGRIQLAYVETSDKVNDLFLEVQALPRVIQSRDVQGIRIVHGSGAPFTRDDLEQSATFKRTIGTGQVSKVISQTALGFVVKPSPRELLAFWDYNNKSPLEQVEVVVADMEGNLQSVRGRINPYFDEKGLNLEIQQLDIIPASTIRSIGVVKQDSSSASKTVSKKDEGNEAVQFKSVSTDCNATIVYKDDLSDLLGFRL